MDQPNKPVGLPYYLDYAMDSLQTALALKADLREVFTAFFVSDQFTDLSSACRKADYIELYNGIATLLESYIMQRLGALSNRPTKPLPEDEKAPLKTDMLPVFMNNPYHCEDLDKLREWVFMLQNWGQVQERRIECQERLIDVGYHLKYAQERQIEALERLNQQFTTLHTNISLRVN